MSNSDDNERKKVEKFNEEFPIIFVSNKKFSISNIITQNIAIGFPLIFDTSIREPETHNENPISNENKMKCIQILKDDFEYS